MRITNKFILLAVLTLPSISEASVVNFAGYWVHRDIQTALLRSFENCTPSSPRYRTPARVRPLQVLPLRFDTPQRHWIRQHSERLPETPEGVDPRVHRRAQIDNSVHPDDAAAARYRRYCRERNMNPQDAGEEHFETWAQRYEVIQNNGANGRAAETHALREFNLDSNNVGHPITFADETEDGCPVRRRRPDGVGADENGRPVVAEVKHKTPDSTVYATRQIRTEETGAREANGRHVVILSLTQDGEFPRVSRSFRDMITEFRLVVGLRVYRLNKETNTWELVGE